MRFIGSKTKLLDNIDSILSNHIDGTEERFVDLFAGSNSVGLYFKNRYEIFSNDLMYFSTIIAKATIENNYIPEFKRLKKIEIDDPFKYFNAVNLDSYPGGFITKNYSPANSERMYFSVNNAKKIDFIRTTIEQWKKDNLILSNEYFYLLNSLIQAVPYISNITGTYGAYLKKWDKRALKDLELEPVNIIDNGYNNKVFNEDSVKLVMKLKGDIVYIDTPYNSRQYAPSYHILETIAKYDNPEIHGITGLRDYHEERSAFSIKGKAKQAMRDLLKNLNFKHALLSYSTDGIIPEAELLEIIEEASVEGSVEIHRINYRKYKSKVKSNNDNLFELLYYFKPKKYSKENKISKLKKASQINVPTSGFIKSPLNYVGGKYKLLPQIFPLFPKESNVDVFVDLFSGGGNVGINYGAKKVYLNDINNKINGLFRYLQGKNPEDILRTIQNTIKKNKLSKVNQEAFLKFREKYNDNPNPLDLYILVAYSFNYQFRFNNNMKYNNPFGKNRSSFTDRMADNLTRFMKKLNVIDAEFTDHYFTDFNTNILTKNSFVYADPPYLITTGSYNDGNRGFVNWTEKQEKELYNFLDELDRKKIKFALSNVIEHKGRENILLKNWAENYNIHYLNYSYRNSSHNTVKLSSQEVLITNY